MNPTNESSSQRKIQVLVYGGLWILILIFSFSLLPFTISIVRKNSQQIFLTKKILEEKKRALEEFEKLKRLYESLSPQIEKLKGSIFEKIELPKILLEVEKIASTNGMILKSISFGQPELLKEKDLGKISLSFKLTGRYQNFKYFLADLTRALPLIEVENLNFSPPSTEEEKTKTKGLFTFTLNTTIFVKDTSFAKKPQGQSQTSKVSLPSK